MKTPEVGAVIPCTSANLAFRNSPTPSVRLQHTEDQGWIVAPADATKGLMAYIRTRDFAFDRLVGIVISDVRPQVVFAEVVLE